MQESHEFYKSADETYPNKKLSEEKTHSDFFPHLLADRFFQYLISNKGLSTNTSEAYARDLSHWLDFLQQEEISWKNFSHEHVTDYMIFLGKEKQLSKSSMARNLSALKSFYRFLETTDEVETNPLKHSRAPKYQKRLPRPVRAVEMERFLEDSANSPEHLEARDMALWEMMYSCGTRISEILALNVADVFDFSQTPITVFDSIKVTGKGSRQRMVFIGKFAATALLHYHELRNIFPNKRDSALFLNKNGSRLTRRGAAFILQNRRKRLQLTQEFTPHSLRHSFATDMLNLGADIRHVQSMLGHSSVSTTQNYTYVAKERLQDVMRKSHPHAKKK